MLLFTSGTTGEPKAAVLRHRHLTSYVLETVEFMGAEPDEAALVSVPPYHIAGIAAVLTSVWSGRRLVYLPQFTAESWVDLAAREAVTHAMVVPDHARPHPRGAGGARRDAAGPAAPLLRRRAHAAWRWSSGRSSTCPTSASSTPTG